MFKRWKERRHWRRLVNTAIKNGTLGKLHYEYFGYGRWP